MKVLFDLMHPAHVNFFRHLVSKLHRSGIETDVIVLARGAVPQMVKKDYPDVRQTVIGRYSKNIFGVFLITGFWRAVRIFFYMLGKKYRLVLGVSAFQSGFAGKFFGARSFLVYDDPEHKVCFPLSKWVGDRLYMPKFCGVSARNIRPFNALKEWAYLSPKYFKPDPAALAPYQLKPKEYVFIREVETRSLNYRGQTENLIEELYRRKPSLKVVLSLENKSRKELYKDWLILEEPVEDIHSLIYFSRMLIANGDSMAREGGMLGVPSIYCGCRDMGANRELIGRGMLEHIQDIGELTGRIDQTAGEPAGRLSERQNRARATLDGEWEDINEILFKEIEKEMRRA